MTGFFYCCFTSQRSPRPAAPLLEFCLHLLDLFHPLGLAECTWLMLGAWISRLPRVSQACWLLLQNRISRCWLCARLQLDQVYCKQLLPWVLVFGWVECGSTWKTQTRNHGASKRVLQHVTTLAWGVLRSGPQKVCNSFVLQFIGSCHPHILANSGVS